MTDTLPSPTGSLVAVPQGTQVAVAGLAAGDPLIRRRLFDLGFRPGVQVTPVRTAPLGDPRVYRMHGADLSLRRTEASLVLVGAADALDRMPTDQAEVATDKGVDK